MSPFEFSLIPIAIVIGFAITRLLTLWASLIRNWGTTQKPGFYLSISLLLLVALLVHFIGLWAYREITFHSLETLLLVIAPTLFFMLSISLLVPADGEVKGDLSALYFDRSRTVLGFAALAVAASTLPDLLPGVLSAPNPWAMFAYAVPLTVLAITRNRTVHFVGHAILWLAIFGLPYVILDS